MGLQSNSFGDMGCYSVFQKVSLQTETPGSKDDLMTISHKSSNPKMLFNGARAL